MRTILAALLGVGVMLFCFVPPVIHFVTGPLSPLIGGLAGVTILKVERKYAMLMGFLMGLFALLPIALALIVGHVLANLPWQLQGVIAVVVFTYTIGMGIAGATFGSHKAAQA